MSELKPKSFRIDDETAEKFKQISGNLGGNQQEALAKLIESFEFQQGKMIFTKKVADIENFEKHVTILTRMFMGALEDNHYITETVYSEFEAQLTSKDSVIQDLQEKLKNIQKLNKDSSESSDLLKNETITLQQELENLNSLHEKQRNNFEAMMKDKNSLNDALSHTCESLKKEVEILQITRKEAETLENENENLQEQVNTLTKKLEKHSLDQENLLLSIKIQYQQEKQNEVDKYQQKYLELLESLKKSTPVKKTEKTTKNSTNDEKLF